VNYGRQDGFALASRAGFWTRDELGWLLAREARGQWIEGRPALSSSSMHIPG